MSSIVDDLNDGQFEALKQLKKNISDILPADYPDGRLLKWLRSHSFSLKKTESAFRATVRMREVYQFDSMVDTYVEPEAAVKYAFTSFLGIAKNGSPSGRQVDEVTYVVDMEGFSIQQLMIKGAVETGLDLLQLMQDHYPEMWGNIFVVNAPSYFERAFNMFKPIMRLTMLQKIRVASRDSSPSLLLKYIDEEELPAFLGGKRTDSTGDPKCSEFIRFGGEVPPEYFLCNVISPLSPLDEGVSSVWVPARSVHNHAVVVRQPDSRLHVEFRTENGGISFKMLYRPLPAQHAEDVSEWIPACDEYLDESRESCNVRYVSPAFRMQSHTTPVEQRVRAPWPGIYIFRFDNTYSWFTSRQVIYGIRIDGADSS